MAVFFSEIAQLPSESYVSPAYIDITHATLDGTPAQVSVEGPSGTVTGLSIGASSYLVRYPLNAETPTSLTLHRNGISDTYADVVWQAIDIGGYGEREAIQIRLGESLLLTAGVGQTGAVQIAVVDSDNQTYRTCSGVAGARFPVLFDRAGVFTATAWLNDVCVGTLVVSVVYVDFDGPVACQVGFKREKGVAVYGPADQVFFTAKDPALLEVSVKEVTSYGVRLYLKALGRGTPVVQARLGSATGPILSEQEVDEFTVDTSEATHVVVNGATDTANTILTMKPWIPNLDINFAMFAHYSTFAGGATAYGLNSTDFDAKDVNGGPAIELSVDSSTGETQAIIHVDLDIPDGESSYCFSASFDQHSKYGTVVAEANCNGTKDVWELTEAYWGQSETGAKPVTVKCQVGHNPGKPHTVISDDADFAVVGTGAITCTPGASVPISVNKTAGKTAGKYNLKIKDTPFPVLCVKGIRIVALFSASKVSIYSLPQFEAKVFLPPGESTGGLYLWDVNPLFATVPNAASTVPEVWVRILNEEGTVPLSVNFLTVSGDTYNASKSLKIVKPVGEINIAATYDQVGPSEGAGRFGKFTMQLQPTDTYYWGAKVIESCEWKYDNMVWPDFEGDLGIDSGSDWMLNRDGIYAYDWIGFYDEYLIDRALANWPGGYRFYCDQHMSIFASSDASVTTEYAVNFVEAKKDSSTWPTRKFTRGTGPNNTVTEPLPGP